MMQADSAYHRTEQEPVEGKQAMSGVKSPTAAPHHGLTLGELWKALKWSECLIIGSVLAHVLTNVSNQDEPIRAEPLL